MVKINRMMLKSIFLLAALFAVNGQWAMEKKKKTREKKLMLIKKLGPFKNGNKGIKTIRQYEILDRDIILVTTGYEKTITPLQKNHSLPPRYPRPITTKDVKKHKKYGRKHFILDLKNRETMYEIDSREILNSPECQFLCNNNDYSQYLNTFKTVRLFEKKKKIFLNFHPHRPLKNWILQYNCANHTCEKVKKQKIKEQKKTESPKKYRMEIYHHSNQSSRIDESIHHDDYTVNFDNKGDLNIEHKKSKKTVEIELTNPSKDNASMLHKISACPKKGSPYIAVYTLKMKKSGNWPKTIQLYDIKTGKPVKAFQNIIDYLNENQHYKKHIFERVIFGKKGDFILFVFNKAIILCDLKLFKIIGSYKSNGNKALYFVSLTSNEEQIMLSPDKYNICIFKNPCVKIEDPDEPERIEYLRTKCPKTVGKKEFFISVGGKKIKVDKSFLFS